MRAVWSESSLPARRNFVSFAIPNAPSEDSSHSLICDIVAHSLICDIAAHLKTEHTSKMIIEN